MTWGGLLVFDTLSCFLKGWIFCSIDVQGFSKGLVSRWNDSFEALNNVFLYARILLEGRSHGLDKLVKILNLYTPYSEKKKL